MVQGGQRRPLCHEDVGQTPESYSRVDTWRRNVSDRGDHRCMGAPGGAFGDSVARAQARLG